MLVPHQVLSENGSCAIAGTAGSHDQVQQQQLSRGRDILAACQILLTAKTVLLAIFDWLTCSSAVNAFASVTLEGLL